MILLILLLMWAFFFIVAQNGKVVIYIKILSLFAFVFLIHTKNPLDSPIYSLIIVTIFIFLLKIESERYGKLTKLSTLILFSIFILFIAFLISLSL